VGKALRRRDIICVLLGALVLVAFAPVLENGFVGYDDPDYVTANPHVNTGLTAANFRWALTAAHANNWHPFTWMSHALDWSLYGSNPRGHHVTSLVLHIANTLLLFLWLSGATGYLGRSAFVAAIFGVHPVHVESVAWVAERKDVLSAFFGICSLLAYTWYARRPSIGRYASVAALFAFSLAAKQTLVVLPVVLLAVDVWPLRRKERMSRLVAEQIPLFVLSILAVCAAFWAQHAGGALVESSQLPAALRLENAALSFIRYVGKIAWPSRLAVFYPYPAGGISPSLVVASVAAIVAITATVILLRRGHPWLAFGWTWYLLTLLPVIGIVQVGMQAMADRYLYLSMIGVLIAAAWEVGSLPVSRALAIVAVGICAALTWQQVLVWHDSIALFRHAIAVTDGNYVAHDNLGVELDRLGRADEALAEYREAIRIRPGDRHAEYNYGQAVFAKGEVELRGGRYADATALFEEGLQHQPGNVAALTFLGIARAIQGEPSGALECFDRALRLDPSYKPAIEARGELMSSRK
jgi:tetratricopeptide (TPR) repeat protein